MTITQAGKGENNRKRIKTSLSVLTYDSSTTIEDKRIYRQKSLRVKWKLKKLYFTWNLLLTVVMLESRSTEIKTLKPGQQNSLYVQSITIRMKMRVQRAAVSVERRVD